MSLKYQLAVAESTREEFLLNGSKLALSASIGAYEVLQKQARQIALFSKNETLDDVPTSELPYLSIEFKLAELLQQSSDRDRQGLLRYCEELHRSFLQRCLDYNVLEHDDAKSVKDLLSSATIRNSPSKESAGQSRATKILRYKKERELEKTLEVNQHALDEEIIRTSSKKLLQLCALKSLQNLEMLQLELTLLSQHNLDFAPSPQQDPLVRPRSPNAGHWQLDRPSADLLSSSGQVLRPFVIVAKQESLRREVFRAGHSLPTMSVDEYLQREIQQGGILQAERPSDKHNDNISQLDSMEDRMEEITRLKDIEWDNFTDNNPKGIGNTMNRG